MLDDRLNNTSHTVFILNGFQSLGKWRPALVVPFLLMLMLSITGNTILSSIIMSKRNLHSPMFVLIGLMSVADLSIPIFAVPNMLFSFSFNWNAISLSGCLIQMFFILYFQSFQSTILLWMALDRYFAICTPLYYHKHMAFPNFLKFIIVPCLRNALIIILVITLAGSLSYCHSNVIDHCFCEHMALVQLACGDTSINSLVGLMGALLIPTVDFVIIVVSYIIIFSTVIKSGQSHTKAFNTCITHIIVIFLLVSLTLLLMAFMSYRIRNNLSSNSRVFLSLLYLLIPSCLNPIIYGVRTKEIRQQFLHVMRNVRILPISGKLINSIS
ncbi:olfactory receptor 52K1-like [Chanos chanos]|uniref:Olfactory receptor 52K1-like n=1 Tax=Chanos chanos TaxID=29144 RepID=A0A6J2VP13_CHACN|nr:olfactory receptor 52K1-like [Chanos chanos]